MKISKYLRAIILSTAILALMFIFLLFAARGAPGFLLLVRFDMAMDSLIVFILTLASSIIFGYLMGYVLGPLFVYVHKKTIGRKMIFGIEERPDTDKFKGYFVKALWPALLSINLAVTFAFNTTITSLITSIPDVSTDPIGAAWATFIALLPITTGVSMALFSPVLFLTDSGIIYHNKEKIKHMMDSTEVRNIGNWYNTLLKGYAGISVILTYYGFIEKMIEKMITDPNIVGGYISAFVLAFYPVVIVFLIVPTLIVLNVTHKKRKSYMIEKVQKFQIDTPMEVIIK